MLMFYIGSTKSCYARYCNVLRSVVAFQVRRAKPLSDPDPDISWTIRPYLSEDRSCCKDLSMCQAAVSVSPGSC